MTGPRHHTPACGSAATPTKVQMYAATTMVSVSQTEQANYHISSNNAGEHAK
jgi:hypothetical protein